MKKGLKVLSVLFSLVMGATVCLTGCGKSNVAEHDHEWGEGKVTVEPTCQTEGIRTFTCTVEGCGQTRTEPIAKTEHNWDAGEVTSAPTCNETGVKTYKCQNEGCNETKPETLDATGAHSWQDGEVIKAPTFLNKGSMKRVCAECKTETTVELPAAADFAAQYYGDLAEANNWQYGYADSFDAETGEVEFVRFTETSGGMWKSGDNLKTGKGYVLSGGGNAVVAYTFTEALTQKMQTNVEISFKGEEENTALKAHLMINAGELTTVELNNDGKKDWTYKTEEPIDIARNVTLWIVFENVGTGKAGGELGVTLTAPCVHVWDDGEVKTPATCQTLGVMEYSCLNCSAKYEGDIQKAPHNWDSGIVEKEATETEEGLKKFTCQNEGCNETKTEAIPKLAPSTFNGADFARDFSTTAQPNWEYGYTKNYDFNANTFTFEKAKPVGEDAWKDNGGIEIKGGWLKNETDGSMAVVRYIMPETREITVAMSFTGSNEVTRMSARLHVTDASGNLDSSIEGNPVFVYDANSKDWSLNKTITVQKGGVISVIFTREGDKGWWHGDFNMTLTATGAAPTETEIANFFEDFGNEEVWAYGYSTDYHFDTNTFTFNALTADGEGNYTSIDGDNKLEIKKDFVLSEYGGRDLAIGYKVPAGQSKLKVNVDFTGANAETQIAPRILVVRGNATQSAEFFGDCENKQNWNITHEVNVAEGDIIYVILFPKGGTGYKQGKLQITITGKAAQQPVDPAPQPQPQPQPTEGEIANFHDDFHDNTVTDSNWKYGYTNDYNYDEHTFTFTELTEYADGGWKTAEKDVLLKNDYFEAETSSLAIGYKVPAGHTKLNVKVEYSSNDEANPRYAARIVVVHADGTRTFVDYVGGTATRDWVADKDAEVTEGDIIYVVMSYENTGWKQGKVQIIISEAKEQQPVDPAPQPQPDPENLITDFNKDFAGTLAGTSNWEVGVVDYKFPEETFTFTEITGKNTEGDAFTDNTGEQWKEIKGDWAAINGMAAFRYTFKDAVNAHVNFHIKGNDSNQYNIRWAITDSEGNVKNEGNKPAWVDGGNDVTLDTDVTAAAGDIFYIFIERNGEIDGDQCNYSLVITGKAAQQPATSFEGANFAEDFHGSDVTDSNWQYGHVDYHFNSDSGTGDIIVDGSKGETFSFTEATEYDSENGAWKADGVEIKQGWISSDNWAAIVYNVKADATADIHIKFTGADGKNTFFNVRLMVVGEDNNVKYNQFIGKDNISEWEENSTDVELKTGDRVFIMFEKVGASDNANGDLEYTITSAQA